MAVEAYLSEISVFAGHFSMRNTMYCDGTLLPISQNSALYSLIGNTFGGDGKSTFALPDLRGTFMTGDLGKKGEVASGTDPSGMALSILISVSGPFPQREY